MPKSIRKPCPACGQMTKARLNRYNHVELTGCGAASALLVNGELELSFGKCIKKVRDAGN